MWCSVLWCVVIILCRGVVALAAVGVFLDKVCKFQFLLHQSLFVCCTPQVIEGPFLHNVLLFEGLFLPFLLLDFEETLDMSDVLVDLSKGNLE